MKTRVRLFMMISALVAALSFFSYTRASVDDGITISGSPAQQTTPVWHPTPVVVATPVIHVTPIAQTTPTRSGRKVGVCVRPETPDGSFVYIVIDEAEIEAHRAHGDIVGVHSQQDCPVSPIGGSNPLSGGILPLTGGNPSTSLSAMGILLGAIGMALLVLSRVIGKRA